MSDEAVKVERILDTMQAHRDYQELEEMNGKRCGGRQAWQLRGFQLTQVASCENRSKKQRRKGISFGVPTHSQRGHGATRTAHTTV